MEYSIIYCVVVIMFCSLVYCDEKCVSDFSSFRREFFAINDNLEKLQDTFYPINKANPVYILIQYYYKGANSTHCPDTSKELYQETVASHYNWAQKSLKSKDTKNLCFWIWTDTVAYLLFPPSFMDTYSLLTESFFSLASKEAVVNLELPKPCTSTNTKKDFQRYLYILTARLKIFASGDPDNFEQHNVRGFSYHLFSTDHPSSVLQNNMITLFKSCAYAIGMIVLLLLSVAQVIYTKRHYKTVYTAAKDSVLFYSLIWSGVYISFILNILLIVLRGLYLMELKEAKIYIKYIGHTVVMLITQLAATLAVTKKFNDFPTPAVLHYTFLGCVFPRAANIFVQSMVILNIFVFIQQIAFHGFFLMISLHTNPIGVASMLAVYMIALFCLVSAVALLMLLSQYVMYLASKKNAKKLVYSILKLLSAVIISLIIFFTIILWSAFALIGNDFLFDATRLTHPLLASLLISGSCWMGKSLVSTFWTTRSLNDIPKINNSMEIKLVNAESMNIELTTPYIEVNDETEIL